MNRAKSVAIIGAGTQGRRLAYMVSHLRRQPNSTEKKDTKTKNQTWNAEEY